MPKHRPQRRRPGRAGRLFGRSQVTTGDTSAPADLRDNAVDDGELRRRLSELWGTKNSILGSLSTVDHKVIGRRYIATAFLFLCLGGLGALVMRLQLAHPDGRVVGPDLYNQIFTMHGTTMMFLFAVPVMEAFAVYLSR